MNRATNWMKPKVKPHLMQEAAEFFICLENSNPITRAARPKRMNRIHWGVALSSATLPAIKPPPQITATISSRESAFCGVILG